MRYYKDFYVSELEKQFNKVLESIDGDFTIFTSLRDGVYCTPVEHPSEDKIMSARDAIKSLHGITLSSLIRTDGERIPAVTLHTLFMYAAVESFEHTTELCISSEFLSATENAFIFRIYLYVLNKWLEEFLYTEPLEVVTIFYDKFND